MITWSLISKACNGLQSFKYGSWCKNALDVQPDSTDDRYNQHSLKMQFHQLILDYKPTFFAKYEEIPSKFTSMGLTWGHSDFVLWHLIYKHYYPCVQVSGFANFLVTPINVFLKYCNHKDGTDNRIHAYRRSWGIKNTNQPTCDYMLHQSLCFSFSLLQPQWVNYHKISPQITAELFPPNPQTARRLLKGSASKLWPPGPFWVDAMEVYWPRNLIHKTQKVSSERLLAGTVL